MSDAENRFEEALLQYRMLLDRPMSHTANLMAHCSRWEELAALVESTEREYHRTAGPIHKVGRWAGDHVPTLQLWAGLLPTDNGLSLLTGGVKFFLGVAEKRSIQRKQMLASLRRMTDVVTKSEVYLKLFSHSGALESVAISLFVALLNMVEACINSLVHKSVCKELFRKLRNDANEQTGDKVRRGFFRVDGRPVTVQEYNEEQIDQICKACDERQREFDWQVEQLTTSRILDTASGVESITAGLTRLQPTLLKAASVSTEALHATQEVRERGRQAEKEIKIVRANVENHGDILDTHSDILVNIKGMLQDLLANSQCEQARKLGKVA